MRLRITVSLLVLTCFFYFESSAQVRRDLASWNAIEIGYELDDNWEVGVEGQLRLKENWETIDEYFGEFVVKRKLFKGFKLGGALRYIRENDNMGAVQGYENHLRYHFDATYKHKLGDFRLGYRLRFQNKNELGNDDEDNFSVQRIRFKTSLEYKIKNWPLDPKVWGELFSRFEKEAETELDKFRITLGTEYNLKDAGSIGAFWRVESSLGETIKDNLYIIGLSYNYTFKN